jgi:hypothetical protein
VIDDIRVGDKITLPSPPNDFWSRLKRFFGFATPPVEQTFIVTSSVSKAAFEAADEDYVQAREDSIRRGARRAPKNFKF